MPKGIGVSDGCAPNHCSVGLLDDRQANTASSSTIVERNSVECGFVSVGDSRKGSSYLVSVGYDICRVLATYPPSARFPSPSGGGALSAAVNEKKKKNWGATGAP